MKKIIFIIILILYSSSAFAAGMGSKEGKTTASSGVKAATKFDIGKKFVSKAKKYEKKNKKAKAKKTYERAIKYLLEANSENQTDPDTLNLLGFSHRKIGDFDS